MKLVFEVGDTLPVMAILAGVLVFILFLYSSRSNPATPMVGVSKSSDTSMATARGFSIISPLKSEDNFSCTAEKLLHPIGTGECK